MKHGVLARFRKLLFALRDCLQANPARVVGHPMRLPGSFACADEECDLSGRVRAPESISTESGHASSAPARLGATATSAEVLRMRAPHDPFGSPQLNAREGRRGLSAQALQTRSKRG